MTASMTAIGRRIRRPRFERAPLMTNHPSVAPTKADVARLVPQPGWIASPLSPACSRRRASVAAVGHGFQRNFTYDEESGRVGMPGQRASRVLCRQHVQRGVLKCVILAGGAHPWQIKNGCQSSSPAAAECRSMRCNANEVSAHYTLRVLRHILLRRHMLEPTSANA